MRYSKKSFWLFVSPIILIFAFVVLIPMAVGIFYSFTDWNGINNDATFVGLSNYIEIFKNDGDFRRSIVFTILFAAVAVVLINLLGFILALIIDQATRLNTILRSIFFMPNLIGGILLGFTWQFIFTKAFENLATLLHLPGLAGWLFTPVTGFWGLVIVLVWQMSGYMMIIYLAALQSVPNSVKEAARIDGANGFQTLMRIIVPLMTQAFTIGLFLTLSNSFKLFDQNLSLTNGGPFKSTEMLALNIYTTAFTLNQMGLAQAKAVIFLILVGAITLTQLYYTSRKEIEL